MNFVRSATQRSASAVKKVIVSASVIALLAGVLALTGDAWSQQGKEGASGAAAATNIPHKVGLIDMAFVFKNYKKFESLREDLKVEIASSEEQAKEMQKEIVEYQQKLKDLKEGGAEYTKLEQQAVKKAAEFENFRRRTAKERLDMILQANSDLLRDLLPIVDDMDRALKVLEQSEQKELIDSPFAEGVKLVRNKMHQTLERKGLKAFDAAGKPFDPDRHEAITQIPAPTEELKGCVVDEIEKGYTLGDRVLRFAKVVVGI
jgi:molecular chaperone GrpE